MTRELRERRPGFRRMAMAALVLATTLVALAGSAHTAVATPFQAGDERIRDFASEVVIAENGTASVTERIVYDFGSSTGRHGIFRYIPVRYSYDDVKKGYDRVTPISGIKVTASNGASSKVARSTSGRDVVLKIGNADKTVDGVVTYDISYTLRGVLNHFDDHDELYLNITGNGWDHPIDKSSARIELPGSARIDKVACFAGPVGSSLGCDRSGDDGNVATFSQGPLPTASGLTVVIGFPLGVVSPTPEPILDQRWSISTAFARRADTVGPASGLALVLVGGFAFLASRKGRDERFAGGAVDASFGSADGSVERAPLLDRDPIPVEFVPPAGIRPGQVGTLIDEVANPLDVTATIIDLAVRGYLRITEIPKKGWLGSPDWQLESLKPAQGLERYETTLLTALFKSGRTVLLSDLKDQFATQLKKVQNQLYDDLVKNKWYRQRPDKTRTKYGVLAVLVIVAGVVITVGLAAFTSFGLLGLPVVLLGLLFIFSNKVFPARTAKGHAVLRRVKGFKQFIEESEKDRARFAEQQNLFSEYLPYAVVFGSVEKWAKTFAGLDGELPQTNNWYVSNSVFNAVMFSHAMNGFTTSSAGTMASTPSSSGSSGFSGGGFSGGGMGGGGGGSW